MIVVDSSVWVSRFLLSDLFHAPSQRWIEAYMSQGGILLGPTLLLVEVAAAISRQTRDAIFAREAISRLSRLSRLRLIPIHAELVRRASEMAADLRLRGADAVYVAAAQQLDVPLVTWDREQRERTGSVIITHTPDQMS